MDIKFANTIQLWNTVEEARKKEVKDSSIKMPENFMPGIIDTLLCIYAH